MQLSLSQTTSLQQIWVHCYCIFNKNTQKALYIITIYKPPQMHINYYYYIFSKSIFENGYKLSPTIIIKDFNTDMFTITFQ
jgi:hypothetical protein